MANDPMTPEDSLTIINNMINRAKLRYQAINIYFLLWGSVIFLAGISFYLLAFEYHYSRAYLSWLIFSLIGGILSSIVGRNQNRKQAPTLIDKILNVVWFTFGISLFLVIFINISNHRPPDIDIMILTGSATIITGYIIRFRPLILGGIIFWLSALITDLFLIEYASIMTSVSVLLGYIIPGLLLKRKEKSA